MPTISYSTRVNAPPEAVWDFAKKIGNWAPFVKGYQGHEELNEQESIWTLKGDIGVLARTSQFQVRIAEWVEGERVAFTLEGMDEPLTGHGVLRIGDAALEATTPRRLGWRKRVSTWLRSLFGHRTNEQGEIAARDPVGLEGTHVSVDLSINFGGAMGPVINRFLAPMLKPIAEELATKLTAVVEGRSKNALHEEERSENV